MTYDLTLSCPGPDLQCDDCQGLNMSNSVEGLILLTLGSYQNNWMNHPGYNSPEIVGLKPNSSNFQSLRTNIQNALAWIVEMGNPIEVDIRYEGRNNLCVIISHGGERSICFDTLYGFNRFSFLEDTERLN